MCYNCDGPSCNACGKYDSDLFVFSKQPAIKCLYCGADVDVNTSTCTMCGKPAFAPPGKKLETN